MTFSGGTPADFEEAMMRYPRNSRKRIDAQESANLQAASASNTEGTVRKMGMGNMKSLEQAWAVTRRVSKDDWLDWYARLCSELLKASPSPALRACYTVAQHHSQLAKGQSLRDL